MKKKQENKPVIKAISQTKKIANRLGFWMEINKNQSSARLLVSAFLSSDSFIPLEIGFSLQLTAIDNNFNQNYGEKHKN